MLSLPHHSKRVMWVMFSWFLNAYLDCVIHTVPASILHSRFTLDGGSREDCKMTSGQWFDVF